MKALLEHNLNRLAVSRFGRVLLHGVCLVRCPAHFRWHWQGIRREFTASRSPGPATINTN